MIDLLRGSCSYPLSRYRKENEKVRLRIKHKKKRRYIRRSFAKADEVVVHRSSYFSSALGTNKRLYCCIRWKPKVCIYNICTVHQRRSDTTDTMQNIRIHINFHLLFTTSDLSSIDYYWNEYHFYSYIFQFNCRKEQK